MGKIMKGSKASKIIEILKANPKLSAERIAGWVGVTPHYVNVVARTHGFEVRAKLKEQSLEAQIIELLTFDPELSIQDLVERVGADQSYTRVIATNNGFDTPLHKKPTLPEVTFLTRDVPDDVEGV